MTMRVQGACAFLLEALVTSGFRIGSPTLFSLDSGQPSTGP